MAPLKGSGYGQARVTRGRKGRMVRCSGHLGEECFRAAELIGFPPDARWSCGEPKADVPKRGKQGGKR